MVVKNLVMEIVNVLRQTLVAQRCVVAMEGAQIVEMTLIDRPVFFLCTI